MCIATFLLSQYGERVHWDLWGPASVKSLSGDLYVAAHTDDHTCRNKLYFQLKKSGTLCEFTIHDSPPQNTIAECGRHT